MKFLIVVGTNIYIFITDQITEHSRCEFSARGKLSKLTYLPRKHHRGGVLKEWKHWKMGKSGVYCSALDTAGSHMNSTADLTCMRQAQDQAN